MTTDSTTSSYWLNWRVLLCAIWVLTPMVIASLMIWKYEGLDHSKYERGASRQEAAWFLNDDVAWKPCLNEIHPGWLLAFRIFAFCFLLAMLTIECVVNGGGMFYYYTQWTFTLVTIYFGFGLLLSIYGCYKYHKLAMGHMRLDAEQESHAPLMHVGSTDVWRTGKNVGNHAEDRVHHTASMLVYVFQVIFQINAGAVMLTDCLYWFIIFPFLTLRDYNVNFLTINMHSINIVFLLGDTALNSLPFPWFRISYFLLWTGIFVLFQWAVHACLSIWWPYPFLDLSSPSAPLWYLLVAILHIPCYGLFALIVEMKHYLFSKWFPHSFYQRLK